MAVVWFIKGNIPSLKNSKVMTKKGIFRSKTVNKYLQKIGVADYSVSKKTVRDYKTRPNLFRKALKGFPKLKESDYPIALGFHFVRDSKREADFINMVQVLQDLMVAHGFIFDDSMKYLEPFPMHIEGIDRCYSVDKDNPGVYIRILKIKDGKYVSK